MWSQPINNIIPGSGQRDQTVFETYWRMLCDAEHHIHAQAQFIFNPSFNPTVDHMVVPSIKFRVVS